ncbi:uncharacterized protein LOC113566262 [Drosophila persimilis]|uniref:Single domain-containing protein n=1 Tax=Drosophila pseudoobscura pseudoobscura TaxID=46245 RepID=Q29CU3_DROPS|nr:uncharacterized protein LOC4811793 [Drosophila pseudoobscura]XP_026846901.1 uncharacterized protein LOC113566262 [Drosophila persimilis]
MNAHLTLILALAITTIMVPFIAGADQKLASDETNSDGEIRIYKRLIPADVLRDFPGMCFASTRCATVEPGKSWDLTPFCGRSTCVQNEDNKTKLLELVEDCGPLPLANDKCKLDTSKTNKTASFPYCCPIFTCEPGITLEYPDIEKEDGKKSDI